MNKSKIIINNFKNKEYICKNNICVYTLVINDKVILFYYDKENDIYLYGKIKKSSNESIINSKSIDCHDYYLKVNKINKNININLLKRRNNYKIIENIKHMKTCFTQGLVIHNNYLYESCGLYGYSKLLKKNLKTGKIEKKINIKNTIFAEGITIYNNIIYLLTWKSQIILCFDLDLNYINSYNIDIPNKECWGITHNSKSFIISNGSNKLYYYNFPKKNSKFLKSNSNISVKYNNTMIHRLNELEYVNNYIYANIWYLNYIIKINPSNGKIVDVFNLKYFNKFENTKKDVLNGIAYDKKDKIFYITGKNWTNIYKMKLF
tara:strand:+ start:10006 stop:10965 length:960 start_codon:yes stop_codon:yes gene_type:complete